MYFSGNFKVTRKLAGFSTLCGNSANVDISRKSLSAVQKSIKKNSADWSVCYCPFVVSVCVVVCCILGAVDTEYFEVFLCFMVLCCFSAAVGVISDNLWKVGGNRPVLA